MGEPKPPVELAGRPFVAHPLAAAAAAGLRAVTVAKPGTPLPPGVTVWYEPGLPVHPLLGIVTALESARDAVVVTACDMPFVPPALLARLAAGPEAAARAGGRLEPFPARYVAAWLPDLRAALAAKASMEATLEELAPPALELADAALVRSIKTPAALTAARAEIEGRRR